jgi:DNA-binding CsgD family transcriptional regulator
VRSLHTGAPFDATYDEQELDERSRRRGIRMEMVVPEPAGYMNPYLRVANPQVRCGPVLGPAILVDDACAVLPGVPTPGGANTAWVMTRPEVVVGLRHLWMATVALSRSAASTSWPDLTQRQFVIARHRARGHTHAAIARSVGISERMVSYELTEVDRRVRACVPFG